MVKKVRGSVYPKKGKHFCHLPLIVVIQLKIILVLTSENMRNDANN